jgi:hypothetical protein
MVERSITPDCKSGALRLRRFESCSAHHTKTNYVSSWFLYGGLLRGSKTTFQHSAECWNVVRENNFNVGMAGGLQVFGGSGVARSLGFFPGEVGQVDPQ